MMVSYQISGVQEPQKSSVGLGTSILPTKLGPVGPHNMDGTKTSQSGAQGQSNEPNAIFWGCGKNIP